MTVNRTNLRRAGGVIARAGTVISAVMLLLTVVVTATAVPNASAATDAGPAQVITPTSAASGGGLPLASGGSATDFSLRLPTGAACTGDSQDAGYRVQSYMVPSTVDPNSLTFGPLGPIPGAFGASGPYRQPLFSATSTAYVDNQTAAATTAGGPGPIVSIPAFRLGPPDVFAPGDIPAGQYNVGIACTKGAPGPTQLDKFWNVRFTVVASASDTPAGVTWTAQAAPAGSTTTTTSNSSTTTSTVAGGSTTSTTRVGGSTTSTSLGGSTTSTTAFGTTTGGGGPSGTSGVGSVSGLAVTGSSTTAILVWAALFLAFGRMAVLLARPPRVRTTP